MLRMLILALMFLTGCVGYQAKKTPGFNPSVCMNVPVGIEGFQYLDPSLKDKKISCADAARCASLFALPAPPNVPCE
ncbi:MAG: hypothetical protein KatS3mg078_0787 [Deltaproteobacteria bacterium]|jgi:hypothetical protein|nr:MAG: hypothetical protein KatS3mg078_0787 [Deltaproteobacteria bacterium]